MPALINQSTDQELGWERAIRKTFQYCFRSTPRVVDVVEDFHFQTLRQPVQPVVIMENTCSPEFVPVRMQSDGSSQALETVRSQWQQISDAPFEYFFSTNASSRPIRRSGARPPRRELCGPGHSSGVTGPARPGRVCGEAAGERDRNPEGSRGQSHEYHSAPVEGVSPAGGPGLGDCGAGCVRRDDPMAPGLRRPSGRQPVAVRGGERAGTGHCLGNE